MFNCVVSTYYCSIWFMIFKHHDLDFIFCLLYAKSQEIQGKSELKLFLYTDVRVKQ